MMIAALSGNSEGYKFLRDDVLGLLFSYDMRVTALDRRDKLGLSQLDYAVMGGATEIVLELLEFGLRWYRALCPPRLNWPNGFTAHNTRSRKPSVRRRRPSLKLARRYASLGRSLRLSLRLFPMNNEWLTLTGDHIAIDDQLFNRGLARQVIHGVEQYILKD
jgi:hypothetical protein